MNILKSVVLVMFFCSLLSSCQDKVYECVCVYEAGEVNGVLGGYGAVVVMDDTKLTRLEAKAEETNCESLVGTNSGEYDIGTYDAPFVSCYFDEL